MVRFFHQSASGQPFCEGNFSEREPTSLFYFSLRPNGENHAFFQIPFESFLCFLLQAFQRKAIKLTLDKTENNKF